MVKASSKLSGLLLASALSGSWRRTLLPFEQSAKKVEELAPLLLTSGAAALVWRRVRHFDLRDTPAARELHQVYRLYTLQAALHQQTIERTIALLRSFEIEPILIKGWAVARLYPEHGLRPYADIDLCVRPEQFASAEIALKNLPDEQYKVDLHRGFAKFGGANFDEIAARSQLVRIEETDVRVLSAEDHLRILCIHLLREGAWRPLWLCDVAAAVESRPANFDWDRCLTGNQKRARWIICAISLAQQLLGADVRDTPAAERDVHLPSWLIPTIMKEWESETPSMKLRHRTPMAGYLRRPAGILTGLRHHWPNPIEATISVRAPFNELPRLPFQFGTCLARTAMFAARLPKLLREQY
jgi:hypothetical protein